MKIKNIDIYHKSVTQDPKDGVKTKFGKLIYTKFFPVSDDIAQIVIDWVKFSKEEKFYSDNCPLFPRTKLAHNEDFCFEAQGLEATGWKTSAQIREIFKKCFTRNGFSYYNPHSFRDTLSLLGKQSCTIEQYHAWSQNLGHSKISTTLDEYGGINMHRQFELIEVIKELKQNSVF